MKLDSMVLGSIAVFLGVGNAVPTWPAAIDELEDVMFLNTGYKNRGFGAHVTPCSFSEFGAGRQTAAEWLRIGFHDMANGNTFREPRGGIDGSIGFELNNGDNIGTGFTTSLNIYGGFLNSRLSVADVIALGVYTSVRACGGPVVPMRGGRKDATVAGPIGVPQPADGTTVFKSRFLRLGFDPVEMIKLVACGHTLGGVHSANFPDIVPAGTAPNDYAIFDSTLDFDNKIVTRYLDGPDTDPLSLGPVKNKRADQAVFIADGDNSTMQALRDTATFNAACSTVLQKMVELVPTGVILSDIIQPYEVKPSGLQLTLLSGGAQIKFVGDIRVRTTVRSAAQIASVQIVYQDRSGGTGGTITASASGTATGFDDSFSFYGFSSNLAASTSISSFTVVVTTTGGATETYNNNGSGFPVQDSVIVQTSQSCLNGGALTVVVAVRTGVAAPTLTITQRVARTVPLPQLVVNTTAMTQGDTIGSYSLYSATYTIASGAATKYGVSSGTFGDDFKSAGDLSATCGSAPSGSSSSSTVSSTTTSRSTSSSTASTTTSSTSSAPTLSHKSVIGAYTFQGCWTEMPNGRVLGDAVFYDFNAMTLEQCATSCAAYTYFGVEYGGECYCGNTLNPISTLAAVTDCSFVCPGSQYEYCGAGNRLELYKKTSSISSSSSLSSTSSSSSSSSTITSRSSTLSSTVSSTASSSTATHSSTLSTTVSSSTSSTTTSRSSTLTTTTRSSTTTSASSTPTLQIVPSVGLYNYHGCFTESPNVRALNAAFYSSDTLTIEECVASCSPYKYAGAEYGRECWCADSFSPGSNLAPDTDCYFTCAGSNYEYCGAGNRLSVYIRNGTSGGVSSSSTSSGTTTSRSSTTLSTSRSSTASSSVANSSSSTTGSSTTTTTTSALSTQTAPAIKPTIGAYKYYGCQTEATNIRALNGASFYNYTAMTNEMCAGNCAGFKYWGTEYGGECYCGNTWNAGSVDAPNTDCYFECPGNKWEYCGAGNRLSAYEKI